MSGDALAALLAGIAAILAFTAIATAGRAPALAGVGSVAARRRRPQGWLGRLGASALGRRVSRGRLAPLLTAAASEWTADELAGAKLVGALAVVAVLTSGGLPALAVVMGPAAWRAPEFLLSRRARRRVADAAREVPLYLDLLAVATSAGLAPQLAVRMGAVPLEGPLAEELRSAIRRIELGRRWRDEIGGVAERLALLDLRRATAILGRGEALGTALAGEVARFAMDVREARRSRAAERARTAPVKMLFPLVFLILPAFLLLTVVPVLLSTMRSIG